jgi:Rod binding domain-containing protein
MNIPQTPLIDPKSQKHDRQVSPEMQKAAQGLEAVFTTQMMKAMRETVEPSEFSLHNSASDIYQGMLDEEYSDIAAKQNSLGLSEQIIDYWLRDKENPQYNKKVSTGGTNENKSNQ